MTPPEPGPARAPLARLIQPPAAKRPAGLSRGWLYFLALVALGVLVVPIVREHPGLSRREKTVIMVLGATQTLAALVFLVVFTIWMFGWARGQLQAG